MVWDVYGMGYGNEYGMGYGNVYGTGYGNRTQLIIRKQNNALLRKALARQMIRCDLVPTVQGRGEDCLIHKSLIAIGNDCN